MKIATEFDVRPGMTLRDSKRTIIVGNESYHIRITRIMPNGEYRYLGIESWRLLFGMTVVEETRTGVAYTIQAARPSGDRYVIAWEGDTITGHHGPLTDDDLTALTPETLADLAFEDGPPQVEIDRQGLGPDGQVALGYPLVWRDGAWRPG